MVGGLFVSCAAPSLNPAVSAGVSASSFLRKKEPALFILKKPPVSMVFPKWAHEIICPDQRFFSFPVRGQIIHYAVQGRRALFGSLYFFLQLLKSCITDCMFYPASILLRRFLIITSNHKFMRKFFALHSTWQHISRLSSKARHVCQILQFCRPPQQVSDLHFSRWTMCEQS